MEYKKVEHELLVFKEYYQSISGGIDGYYEKMILNGECYEVYEEDTLCYFTVHEDRGLTAFVVQNEHIKEYSEVFDYVVGLGLFNKLLFTDNDKRFLEEVIKRDFNIEVQAYNFDVKEDAESTIPMMPTTPYEYDMIEETFGEFLNYNEMKLNEMASFYWIEDDELIAFGGLEPLELNDERFCLSMIVNEKYRGKGYGSEVVRYLIEFLQLNDLQANARCYVKNEISKKTLEKAGMYVSNKLMKVESI